jgi:hypothetical protein
MPDLPTVSINGLEVFSSGSFNGDKYSEADLDLMVDAFDKVGFQPTIKAGHADGQEDAKAARKVFGEPSLGYVSRLYRNGKKLMADITSVPRRFADLIKARSFSRVSSEIYWNYKNDSDHKTYPRVLKAVAFLGADIPAITSLKEIEALFSRNDEGSLFAYDENKNEFRVYDVQAYKEEGTFVIKQEAEGYCVYNPQGEKVKAWPTLEAAQKSLEGYNFKVEGKDEPPADKPPETFAAVTEVHIYTIVQRGDQWCVTTADGSKTLGCHPSKEEALNQLRAVEANKHSNSTDLPVRLVAKFCQSCAEKARSLSVTELRFDLDKVPQKAVQWLLAKRYLDTSDPGMFRNCMDDNEMVDRYPEEETRAKVCASVHQKVTGEWPGEHRSEHSSKTPHRRYQMRITQDGMDYCVEDDNGQVVKKFPSKKEAEDYMNSMSGGSPADDQGKSSGYKSKEPDRQYRKGGQGMTQEEFDEQLKAKLDALKSEMTREYEYRIHKAREDGRAEAERDSDALREEVRKLQAEKRSERIESWIKRVKAEGKLAPAEESKVRALREWIPDNEGSLKYFTLAAGGKTKEHTESPADIFESLFEQRTSMFKLLSKPGSEGESYEETGQELDDPGQEVDRRAKVYQQAQRTKGTDVSYGTAVNHVLKQDQQLANKYHELSRH